jgi:hypothetical protein
MSSASDTASPPAKPPPMKVKVSRRLRSLGSLVGRRLGEVREDAVAHGRGLLDLLEADRVLGETGDRQQARHRAEAHDEVVVGDLELLALLGVHDHRVLGAADRGDGAGDDLGAGEDLAQRREDVAGIDAAGADLGEEGRVGHVRARVDDGDRDLRTERLAQLGRGGHADGTAAEDEDMGLAAEGVGHVLSLEPSRP